MNVTHAKPPLEELLFSPQKPLRIFVFASNNASAIQYLQRIDPLYGYVYTLVGAFTYKNDAPCTDFFARHTVDINDRVTIEAPIPCEVIDWKQFRSYEIHNDRDDFFRQLLFVLRQFSFDIVVCSGFNIIIPEWFLQVVGRPFFNVHPADLSKVDEKGRRKYTGTGTSAIQKTIDAGCISTRSTVHRIDKGAVDTGTIIAQSQPCIIAQDDPALTIRARLKLICDGAALQEALRKVTSGEFPL